MHVGEVVRLRARVTATFRTSMEIEVQVHGEDTGHRRAVADASTARVVFVAIDDDRRPVPVPPLLLETDEIGPASRPPRSGAGVAARRSVRSLACYPGRP